METSDYIKRYSELYKQLGVEADNNIKKYTLVPNPTFDEIPSQIDLHMFWQIPLPEVLVKTLESYIIRGIFFEDNLDVYYHVNSKYWPLVVHFTGFSAKCRQIKESDFTYSLELYAKSPNKFTIHSENYSSLECLKTIRVPCDMMQAGTIGSVECLQYLYANNVPFSTIMNWVASYGHLDCIIYLASIGAPWVRAMASAASHGHIHCMEYMRSCDVPWEDSMTAAAYSGKLAVIKYLHEKGVKFERSAEIAAYAGHVDCLEYMYTNGACMSGTMEEASLRGRLDCIKYLECINIPWGDAMRYAIIGDHLDCVRYMHSRDVPWDDALSHAKNRHRDSCVAYIEANPLVTYIHKP